ncbi:MAG: hypothetical protein ACRDNL_29155 [Spirillospora sp.]
MATLFRSSLERNQSIVISHRMDFWGRPSLFGSPSWRYEGERRLVERPADGEPARRWSVQCPVCGKTLNYAVHSVAATRRRRVRAWGSVAVTFTISVAALVLAFTPVGEDTDIGTTLIIIFAVGGAVMHLLRTTAGRQRGFVGHGASWPTVPKHDVMLTAKDESSGK